MPVWVVRATWIEDEAEASEQWEVNADSAHDAVGSVTTHLRFQPHHVEARLGSAASGDKVSEIDLVPGVARHRPPQ